MPKMRKFTAGLLVFLVVLAMPFCATEKHEGFWNKLILENEAWAMGQDDAKAIYVNKEFILPTGQKVLAQKLADDQKEAEAKAAEAAKKQAEAEALAKAAAEAEKAKKAQLDEAEPAMSGPPEGEYGTYLGQFEITAYCSCAVCCGAGGGTHTASGAVPKVSHTVAVDTSVIPMGSLIYIEGVGTRVAEDTGGLIKGKRLDIYMADHGAALKWGRQTRKVWLQQ